MGWAYFLVAFTSVLYYVQIFKAWREVELWKDRNFDKGEDALYGAIPNHIFMIRGIPRHLNPYKSANKIKKILS